METVSWFEGMCFPKATGKGDQFWKRRASWSRSPRAPTVRESCELGTSQCSLASLAGRVLQTLGWSISLQKCYDGSSEKVQNLQKFPGRVFPCLIAQEIYLCADLLASASLVSLPYVLLPAFLHVAATLNPIISLPLHV